MFCFVGLLLALWRLVSPDADKVCFGPFEIESIGPHQHHRVILAVRRHEERLRVGFVVPALAARAGGAFLSAAIRATRRRTKSSASAGSRSSRPSAQR